MHMKLWKTLVSMICLAVTAGWMAPQATAGEWNRKTVVTFSGPVEIPGVHLTGWGILPAGTYVFKIFDSQADRHIVQIFSKDETKIYATILAIPNYRLKTTDKTVMTFSERPAGQPEALRAWFYPGRQWGEEFVYPKSRAMEIAKQANTAVLFTEAELPAETSEPIKSIDEPVVATMKQAPVMAVEPSGEKVELAQAVTAPPAEAEPTMGAAAPAAAETLPATGSDLPMIGLAGVAALVAAVAVRAAMTRMS